MIKPVTKIFGCWKILLSENFCPKLQNLGLKPSLRKFRCETRMFQARFPLSEICPSLSEKFNFRAPPTFLTCDAAAASRPD